MTPYDSLAAYVFPDVMTRYNNPNDLRAHRSKPVNDDAGHDARIPSPVAMAQTFARPLLESLFGVVHRLPGGKLVSATGTAIRTETVAEAVFASLMALPARADLGPYDAYTGLSRLLAASAVDPDDEGDFFRAYARQIASATFRRDVFPAPPALLAEPKEPRGPALTPAARKAAQRARDRATEEASALWWLTASDFGDLDVADERPISGERITAPALYERATSALEALIEEREDVEETFRRGKRPGAPRPLPWGDVADYDGYPAEPVIPGPRTFYRVADHVLGERRLSHGERVYTAPEHLNLSPLTQPTTEEEPTVIETAESIRKRADAIREEADALAYSNDELERRLDLLDRQRAAYDVGDLRGALEVQRERLGADPVDFLAYRARKVAA